MTKTDDRKTPAATERAERLAAALRDNLRRRKAQTRGRTPESPPAAEPGGVEGDRAED